jgi:myo-inositol-1(or 4)-monophosphatase
LGVELETEKLRKIIWSKLPEIINRRGDFKIKEDGSYVTEGDLFVQSIVQEWVRDIFPEHELISEESFSSRADWDSMGSYVVLDPIDGTENFVSGLKEWGVGLSIYSSGEHKESCIFLPELNDFQITGMPIAKHSSRIIGLSSSLTVNDMRSMEYQDGVEFRMIGCAMYNLLMAARGSFKAFKNVKGVNCWDILPGLNLAIEAGCKAWVDDEVYQGQILFPTKKYRVRIQQQECL